MPARTYVAVNFDALVPQTGGRAQRRATRFYFGLLSMLDQLRRERQLIKVAGPLTLPTPKTKAKAKRRARLRLITTNRKD